MKLILLSGWKGSGKDTAADYLVNFGYERLGFADTLKEMVSEQYAVPLYYFHDRTLKEQLLPQYPIKSGDGFASTIHTYMAKEHGAGFHTPRSLCILEGSVKRSVDADYWVKRAVNTANPAGKYVIADWRYRSEYQAIAALPGAEVTTVRINRFESTESVDPSERDLDQFIFDYTIANIGSIENLLTQVEVLI